MKEKERHRAITTNLPPEVYAKTMGGERWELKMERAEYIRYVFRKHIDTMGL